ncbi:Short-chain dehydrogenase/reductase family protein [Mycena indigotica]|uniref:Short-chain dehydrogenase/reductase family protein n=1 Tax=Mycena indigotica TaxID=2126181 RepID=A0A8H6S9Q9_9AGAR|nr:Short-chain dehydrogenase/reductase family protein [Mycena indigotica]KAF7294908.1 Short-chain dehydrogenase/reductase family protein [Mycena indigotica]
MSQLPPYISDEDADTTLRVLSHIMAHGLGGIPMQKANRIRILAKDIAAGRYFKPNTPRKLFSRCYICRRQREYDITPEAPPLCEICTTFNAARRADIAVPDLFHQKSALVTGGRINLGYSVALALLRGGASSVIVTTRFPEDALTRYMLESDYELWCAQLHILQADFTSPSSIQKALEAIHGICKTTSSGRLDILINNAALTVPIPEPEYQRLIANEQRLITADHHALAAIDNALVTTPHPGNAWESRYCDFTYQELLDVLAINAVCPFILIRECVRMMLHNTDTHIINVSSREGMFEIEGNRRTAAHVHTNMAKAALNMCTQTLAEEFRGQRVYINSVDPGYLSHQHSVTHNGKNGQEEFDVPLSWQDGAARVLHPIIRKPPITGAFFKDFTERNWTNGWV